MLSNKLTFSLVFIVMVALTFAFVASSAMAQMLDTTLTTKEGFVVVERSAHANAVADADVNNGIAGSVTDVSMATAPNVMPNLEDFFRWGGTIELSLAVGNIDGGGNSSPNVFKVGTATADPDGKNSTTLVSSLKDALLTDAVKKAFREKAKHRAVITEVMWGLNLTPGTTNTPENNLGTQNQAQWIEVYNNGAVLAGSDNPTLEFFPNKTQYRIGDLKLVGTGDTAAVHVIVDSVSARNRFNVAWTLPGNSGNTEPIDDKAPANLVSMYRKRDLSGGKYKADKTFGRGDEGGSWAASSGRVNMTGYFVGSPGSVHVDIGGTPIQTKAEVAAVKNKGTGLIINEFRNDNSERNVDWIELHNNSDEAATVKGRRLYHITAEADSAETHGYKNYEQTLMAILPDYSIPAGGYLLIVNRDPKETILAGGINITEGWSTRLKKGATHEYYIDSRLNLPNDGNFMIVLRSGDKTNSHEQFVDFAGNGMYPNTGTEMWPLRGWAALSGDHFTKGVLNAKLVASGNTWARGVELKDDGQYRAKSSDSRLHKDHWVRAEDMGGVGYDRDVDLAIAPGTPGYPNTSAGLTSATDRGTDKDDYTFDGKVTISEIMYDAGPRWNQVQWIELYNSSMTEAVNLSGWELEIRNKEDVDSYVDSRFTFRGSSEAVILPNQTLLLVSGPTGNTNVPSTRVYNLYEHHRIDLGLLSRQPNLLSRTGFNLKLHALRKEGNTTYTYEHDAVGNVTVDGAKRTVEWALEDIANYDSELRQSIVRLYGDRKIADGPHDAEDGTMMEGWRYADIDGAGAGSYYGHLDDVGTPGFRLGGPLPVSLSSFRPVRDKATGEVVIRWVTESELNNAGFNILRSETKHGEFKVVNVKGIVPGHGTTSEKHVYEWKDTTAKPNVIYYYQIEDVSLDGARTTLATTRLKGHVSAANKLTTTWGDLKDQR